MNFILYEIVVHHHATADVFWTLWRIVAWPSSLAWQPGSLIIFSWSLFALYWLVTAIAAKKASKQEGRAARLLYVAFMVAGYLLIRYSAPPPLDFLNHRFVPDDLWTAWFGAVLTLAGVLFAIWARTTIGRNWSAEVQIKQDHQLIRSGPYAHIRHPIYTGILTAVLGSAFAIGEYHSLFGMLILASGFARKAKKEEAFLAAQFGPAFAEHQRHTGFFLPRFS